MPRSNGQRGTKMPCDARRPVPRNRQKCDSVTPSAAEIDVTGCQFTGITYVHVYFTMLHGLIELSDTAGPPAMA